MLEKKNGVLSDGKLTAWESHRSIYYAAFCI